VSGSIEKIWAADGPAAWALAPLSWVFRAVTGVRNALYDVGVLRSHSLGLPAVSVGNLSVGGTGKTPVSAWVAAELMRLGGRPAIVMRGYGADEPLVHRRLNPDVPVYVNADRVAGAREAAAGGATVVVLDDAIVLPDKDRFLNEENPFEAMMSRFDRAAELLDLEPGIYKHPAQPREANHRVHAGADGQRRRRGVHGLPRGVQHVARAGQGRHPLRHAGRSTR
jgi:hypothetical protein